MPGSVSLSPGLHIGDFEAGEAQALLGLSLLQIFMIRLGDKGEAVLGGVGLWGQHCTRTGTGTRLLSRPEECSQPRGVMESRDRATAPRGQQSVGTW